MGGNEFSLASFGEKRLEKRLISMVNRLSFQPEKTINATFVRVRGLITNSADIALGLGFVNNLNNNWKLELIGDYYLDQNNVGLNLGICKLF